MNEQQSLASNNSSSLLLVAVVEHDVVPSKNKKQKNTTRWKLRVHRHSYPEGDLSARELLRELLLRTSATEETTLESSTEETYWQIIQLYDKQKQDYLNLADLESVRIVQRFGRRLRIRVVSDSASSSRLPTKRPLAIAGRFYEFGGYLDVGGHRITISEDPNLFNAGTAINVWDGAIVLARLFEAEPQRVQGLTVLELGAGCGLAGIAASVLGAQQVVLTDLPSAVPRLRRNIDANRAVFPSYTSVSCCPCDWFDPCNLSDLLPSSHPDLVLVADCVWMEDLIEPLFATLRRYTMTPSASRVLFAYQRRGKRTDEVFWEALSSLFGTIEHLHLPHPILPRPDIFHLLVCHR